MCCLVYSAQLIKCSVLAGISSIPLNAACGLPSVRWSCSERGRQVSHGDRSHMVARLLVARRSLPDWRCACAGTLVAPPLAQMGIMSLCVSRAVVGLGEGFAPSAVTHVMATLVPASERSRAVSYVFGGLDLGSVIGLLLCGPLIAKFGWPSVFYVFGVLGLGWAVMWPLCKPTQVDPLVQKERELLAVKDEERRQENAEAAGTVYVVKDTSQDGPVCSRCC